MKPLKGLKVLDLTTLNGYSTMTLADYGAEVIKVERPKTGDPIRFWEPYKEGVSVYHTFLDRGKKSITLNLLSDEGKEIFKDLIKHVDVVVENFRVGKMDELGLGYEVLEKINPKLIYAALTGFGSKGPLKKYPAFDIIVQAKTGFMDFTGFADEAPTVIGFPISDQYSCLYLAAAISTAYFHVLRTGEGQKVETSMWEALFSAQEDKMYYHEIAGKTPKRTGNAHPEINPYDIIECKDGYVTLGVSTDPQWANFALGFGKPEWAEDPKYKDMEPRGLNYFDDLRPKIVELFKDLTKQQIADVCSEYKVPAAACNTVVDAMEDVQIKSRNMVVEVNDQRIGPIKMVGKTAKFHQDNEFDDVIESAPLLGQNNDEMFKDILGYTDEKINGLSENGVI
ncbi:CaiB/BaiF CoA-transferase family protein [Clostridium sediminicola]|uniref:CaiB/BaiF CoA transferase family protein n=1 Tax=Clostridium sediminicola TaxID=3114879 RepID=UPI0031F242D7